MNVWATTDCHRREPEVSLWQVCRPDLVTPVTRRSRKPLARIVAKSWKWLSSDYYREVLGLYLKHPQYEALDHGRAYQSP